jgi:alpha-1,2-mannosyltransferase
MNFRSLLRVFLVGLLAFYIVTGSYVHLFVGAHATLGTRSDPSILLDLTGRPVGADFLPYWSASRLAATGEPAAVYDVKRLYVVERSVLGTDIDPMLWNYPPTFLLILWPLSFFGYLPALAVWVTLTMAVYLWVTYRTAPHPLTPWLTLAFPGVVNNFLYAQNGFLSGSLMGAGLLILDRQPFAGGLLLGLLSYKPQLAVLIPIALLAGRRWSALAGVAASATLLALASMMLFGVETWMAFHRNLAVAAEVLHRGDHLWSKMPTVFSAARSFGAGETTANLLQGMSALTAAAAVAWIWFRNASMACRNSALVVGTFLTVPYAFEYDQAMLALPFAWLGWRAYTEKKRTQLDVLLACWLGLHVSSFGVAGLRVQSNPLFMGVLLLFTLYMVTRPLPAETAAAS